MQSTPTLKDTDPHDVFAIESLLAAHAEKAPSPAHDPAAPSVAPQVHVAAKPQAQVAPQISVSAPIPQVEPTFRDPDVRDIQLEHVRPSLGHRTDDELPTVCTQPGNDRQRLALCPQRLG